MSASGFDYEEFKNYAANLGKTEKDFQTWLKTFLLKEAQKVVRYAKQRQRAVGAIDTGAMINSWYIGKQKISLMQTGGTSKSGAAKVTIDPENSTVADIKVVGSYLEVTIGNPMEYASFIEYGQRSYVGKFILTVSIALVYSALPSDFERDFIKFLKDKGVK